MALSKSQKSKIVADAGELLANAKMAVMCEYKGLSVAEMQELRSEARKDGTKVMVIKNRLLRVAASQNDKLKSLDLSQYKGQLLYIFNNEDEIAPARLAATFAKAHPNLVIRGAFSDDANLYAEADAKNLAALPTKQQLRGQLAGLFLAPLSGFANVLNGNIRGVLTVLNVRSEKLEN